MNNSDMPAMPSDVEVVYAAMTDKQDSWGKAAPGLTKREDFAIKLMAGMYSNSGLVDDLSESSIAVIASISTKAADALLAELERTKCQS